MEEEEKRLRATALETIRTITQARQRAEQELVEVKDRLLEETRLLERLHEVGVAVAAKRELQAIVQVVTDAATEMTGARFGAFFYSVTSSESGEEFLLFTLSGAPRSAFERLGNPRNTAIFGPTFRGECVVRIPDVTKDPRYGKMAPHHGMPSGHLPVKSYLAVPVMSRTGSVIGGLFFGHETADVFTERAEKLVVGIAAQAGIAIDNARMFEQASALAEERARMLEAERTTRRQIERTNTMKDEFLATLSHELRTPLNAILGWSEVLRRKGPTGDMAKGLETIERNARAQAQLIEDLLDMNRILSGKLRLDVQTVEIATVALAAAESVRPAVEAKAIRLRQAVDPRAPVILGDPNRLQQVVWNLLTNAVKFTPKGGKIGLVIRRVNSHVEIVVIDTGVGIDADFLPHVFERFRQADASPTRYHGGLGLGLSIVKQLVELHGGTVRVESKGRDQGATFTVTLPVSSVQLASDAEHPTAPRAFAEEGLEAISLAGLEILVVDDEPDGRELVVYALESAGAHAVAAASANEALALLDEQRFDVIVSDIGMPGRDGYDLIREVRTRPLLKRVPAVALTAFARSEDRTRAMLAGYQVHVTKPIHPQELVATIHSLAASFVSARP